MAPIAWYAMPHVLNPRGVALLGCRRTARAARLLAAHQHQHRPHTSLRPFRIWTFCAPARRQARQVISLSCAVDGCWRPGSTAYAGDRNCGPATMARKTGRTALLWPSPAAYVSRMRAVLGGSSCGISHCCKTSGAGVAVEPATGWHGARACRAAVVQPRRFGAPALRVPVARA